MGAGHRLYVYYVKNRRADDIAPALNGLFGNAGNIGMTGQTATQTTVSVEPGMAGSSSSFKLQSEVRITADSKNNALLIFATPADYRSLQSTLDSLDILPMQVMIEATIAEVTLNDSLKYGVQWFFQSGKHQAASANDGTPGVEMNLPGFSYTFSGMDVQTALNALDSVTDVNVVSTPQIMVLNNETARLQVGDQVPIVTQSSVSTNGENAPVINSVDLRDTGVILEVTPRVNPSGLVILDVTQEVSEVVATTTSQIDSPTIQQRKISSTVAVESEETIALGGLMREARTVGRSGVPVLMHVPIVGNLFKTKTDVQRRTELLVLLKPRVIHNAADARNVTDELRGKLPEL